MALCVVVKLEDVDQALANPPIGYKLISVCQHQGTDPKEAAEEAERRKKAMGENNLFVISSGGIRLYEWRELYYELIDIPSLLPSCVPTSIGDTPK